MLGFNRRRDTLYIEEEDLSTRPRTIKEDYARGIPEHALRQVASDAGESIRRLLKMHINQVVKDPKQQREALAAANVTVEEVEADIMDVLENGMMTFARRT